jgi:plasmid stabilization system protein ParE
LQPIAIYRVYLSQRARADLFAIRDYIRQSSPQNALAVTLDLLQDAMSLNILPYRYKVHQNRRKRSRTIRSMPAGSYVIYYRVDETDRSVEIMSFRHGSRRRIRFQ